jgi:hypothetical protein
MSKAERKAQLFALMRRYIQLGSLLKDANDIDPGDAAEVVEARMVLAEMAKTKSEMDRLLNLEAAARRKASPL